MPRFSIFNRADDGLTFTPDDAVLYSDEQYYDPFRVASARRYWRIQAINSHIVNSFGAAEFRSDSEDSEILRILRNSSPHLAPQWAADLQIDGNAFGVLEGMRMEVDEPMQPTLVRYVAPQAISVLIWQDRVVGYELTPRFNGVQAYTTEPIIRRPFTGAKNQYPTEMVIHLKNGLDPRYGEMMGDNKLRDLLEIIRIDAELTHYTRDIVRNVASNSFILMPAANDPNPLRFEALQNVLQDARRALTRVARGGIALLPGRVDPVNVGKNPRDLQFSDLHKDTESAIASAFNVWPILLKWRLGSEHATYSNVEQARQDELDNLIYPLAKVMERGVNDFFARIGVMDEAMIRVPKLYTMEQLIALDEAGLHEAAAEVAEALGLPYAGTTTMRGIEDERPAEAG